ncbi:hypothetical protein HYX03_01420 [Candidatus Woesearchaeota archaeon]|nr:hypothetical protein [Candidatus Woesearchaeota archaeon]
MSKIKKEVLLLVLLLLTSLNTAYADEVGCCSNPGAGSLACSADRLALRDKECCPRPEATFPSYYKSSQNPDSPADYNNCASNFFFPNNACSTVTACSLGCCCSELGGTIKPDAQCKGTGLTFYKGQTNCNQICPIPQCNDNIDNDNNGCADFEGGDLGCASPADNIESGGSCTSQGAGCSNPSYMPKLSSFEIAPAKGERKLLLKWQDECKENAVSYEILRCKDNGCTNFAVIGSTNTNSFEDASGDLLFDTTYTYQVKSRYSLQTAAPTITKAATLGNLECLSQFTSNNFCIHESYYSKYQNYLSSNFADFSKNFPLGVKTKFGDKFNKAYFCDTFNKLVPEGTSCSSTQVCVVNNNKPACLNKVSCNYNSANPFGLFYTIGDCEKDRYCFYDRSYSIVDSCFGCDPSMACYDYKSNEACSRDNCNVGNCKWKSLANQIGVGVCISTSEYNCKWCDSKGTKSLENLRAFNEVFDFCTRDKSNALSEGAFKCYFSNSRSKNCENVICKDYEPEQCSNSRITHDESNKVTNPSSDECGINVCQNINSLCVKNADGDDRADCTTTSCEGDYFAPNTTLLPVVKKGVADSLIVQIYDKTSINSSVVLKTSPDYATFLCVEPCGTAGHPYSTSTASRTIIISNLNAYDGNNGSELLSLNEGANTIRYYSQDPAKNVGEVKKVTVEVHSNTAGPKIFSINITDGTRVLDKLFTSSQKPTVDVQFFEPAIVTFARIISKDKTKAIDLQKNTEPNAKVSFSIAETLPNGEYTLELNAKNKNNIFMDQQLSQIIVIDNNKPVLSVSPSSDTIVNTSLVTIKLTFDKEVNLESVKINQEDIKNMFSTSDNRVFTATLNLSDGNKKLDIAASDFAKNRLSSSVLFIVDANPITINLAKPRFGTASASVFDVVIETDNNAVCRYSLDNNFEFDFMDSFTATGATMHTISNFNKIASGDLNLHKLNVRCKEERYGISFKSFDINVDTTPPQLKSAFAFPSPIVEKPSTTTLTVESDEPVICKFSSTTRDFNNMEGKFEGYDGNNFRIINKQLIAVENETSYLYYIACKNKAELNSETKEILFKVDLTIPISIISHTPEFFNSTNAVLAVETNKKSQCKFSESDNTAQSGDIFGAPGYSHTRQLVAAPGKHTFFIVCKDQFLQKFSDVSTIAFTIDTTPPIVLSVNDSSTLLDKPDFAWSTDNLRVKWSSIDNESKVSSNLYSLLESGSSNVIINWTTSYANNEWVIVAKSNGTSLSLVNGNNYFFRVKAKNIVGLLSDAKDSDGVAIDTSLKPLNCTNGIKDEKETDIDCGSSCDLCGIGKKCRVNIDCRTSFCSNGTCAVARCDDSIKNQDESDLDCGGSCKKCNNNQICNNNNDCSSNYCSFGFCKPQESCSDSSLSPAESDIDCGGPCPTKCPEGKNCGVNEDCGEGLQCASSICKKCADNDKNCNGIPDDQEEKGFKDADNDSMSDEWEIQNGLNPNDPNDANLDSDKDELTNLQEYKYKTNPNLADTDGDGFTDKQEVDAGTNPIDPNDFPKSKAKNIILFILGFIVLLSGFGYLAYRVIAKRKVEKLELPKSMEIPKAIPQQPIKQVPLKKQEEELKIKEALKIKEEMKEKEREKLFEAFGKEGKEEKEKPKAEEKEGKIEKSEAKEVKKEKKAEEIKKEKKKAQAKKPKEDVFIKLKEIAKEAKKPKAKRKNAAK